MISLRVALVVAALVSSSVHGAVMEAASPRLEIVSQGGTASSQDAFTNEDVIAMVDAGFAKETIVAAIHAHGPDFDTSLAGLMTLRDAGVDEVLIVEILGAARNAADRIPDASRESSSDLPVGEGVYVLADGDYVALATEQIEWRSSFWGGGRTRTNALTTTRLNARAPALHSPFEISAPSEMVLVCDECDSALDYRLVRAHDDDDKREFHISFQILEGRNETWVLRGGAGDAGVNFTGERIAKGRYRLNLPALEPGDYAFLPPSRGENPQSLAVSLMHTFRVVGLREN